MIVDRRDVMGFGAGALALAGFGTKSFAQAAPDQLRIGLAAEPSAIDPHFHNLTPNNQLNRHIYEPLVDQDAQQRLVPGLAESWRTLDDTTWEFKLRQATWHDGAPFTPEDVIFTFSRAPNVPRSPSGFGGFVRGRTVEKVDERTIRIRTQGPDPLLPNNLSSVVIIPAKLGSDVTTADFNSGKAAIGTGPYRFVEFVPGERVVLQRYDQHWGGRPAWSRVTFRFIRSDPARVAGLLAGDVDMIEVVPTADVARLKGDQRLAVTSSLSNRLIYFHMDQFRDETPFARAKDGSAIRNPFRDLRVRQAFSLALNRQAIVDRVMEGEAVPAGDFLPEGFFGVSGRLKPQAQDVNRARQLLAAAGFPNGFRLTMHGPAGRYTNDTKIIEAAAQMYTRIGIETSVETMPPATFFTRASSGANGNPEFSFILVGWATGTGEMSESLNGLVITFDRERGSGASNRGRYSNPEVDRLFLEARRTVNDERRRALLEQAAEKAIADLGVIPIHFPLNTWAARRGLALTARSDEYTLAMSVRPA
jgi:peptide/nickel transport system substrate-binding protein